MTQPPAAQPLVVSQPTATPLGRFAWGLMGLSSTAVLLTARALHPDARGYGTHQQLGLPPCEFQRMTHVPCPGCGLTTSFAHMAHGEIVPAFRAHWMGPELFISLLVTALYAPLAIAKKRPLAIILEGYALAVWMVLTMSLGLAMWLGRIFALLPAR